MAGFGDIFAVFEALEPVSLLLIVGKALGVLVHKPCIQKGRKINTLLSSNDNDAFQTDFPEYPNIDVFTQW